MPKSKARRGTTKDQERSGAAVLIIDMINDFCFPGAEKLLPDAGGVARRIAALATRARRLRVPVIYVNDNFGQWRSDFRRLVAHCTEGRVPGRRVARSVRPTRRDYFVLKPMHSGFFGTALEVLLRHLGVHTLIVTGLSGDGCVFATAQDAHMRGFDLYVPPDCTLSEEEDSHHVALENMKRLLSADLSESSSIDLRELRREPAS